MGGQLQPVPTAGGTSTLWWVPNAIVMAAGTSLCVLGVVTKTDTDILVTAGLSAISLATGHVLGKQSPTP
jgi:hypothetical protein